MSRNTGRRDDTLRLLDREALQEILDGSFDGILVTDHNGNVLYVNDSYVRIAEIEKQDLYGHRMQELENPVWLPETVVTPVVEKKSTVTKRQIVKSGRHILVTGTPVLDEAGEVKLVVVNVRDITEIYELTEELQLSRLSVQMYASQVEDLASLSDEDSPFIAVSESMRELLKLAKKVAGFQTTVLILGDSGVGKEEIAKFIHRNSNRSDKPFITINCGAIPDSLLESELFGYEKGAFTGAMQGGKEGLLEAANHGTVFLDEIGETPLDFQVKLLRFMETKEVRRVGSVQSKNIDVRILAATNRNLRDMVAAGKFREDLYFRLNVVQMDVPSLQDRKEDIPPLAMYFLAKYNRLYDQEKILTAEVLQELEDHDWSGNVRELKNVIENMVIVSSNEYLQVEDLPWITIHKDPEEQTRQLVRLIGDQDMTLAEATEELEKHLLRKMLEEGGSTRQIGERLGINQSTVVRKINKYQIK